VQADPNLLRVALDNLLRNAWKFTARQPDAKIEVGVEKRRGAGGISCVITALAST